MYSRFYKCVLENKVFQPKQFGFQVGHWTDHSVIPLDNQIFKAFENNLFTPGVYIDYSKKPLKGYITWYCSKGSSYLV